MDQYPAYAALLGALLFEFSVITRVTSVMHASDRFLPQTITSFIMIWYRLWSERTVRMVVRAALVTESALSLILAVAYRSQLYAVTSCTLYIVFIISVLE